MKKYRNYTDQDIIDNCKNVYSMAGLLTSLNLKAVGGNYDTMKRKIAKLDIDTSHWTCQLWNKGMKLKDWSSYVNATNVKKHLIKLKGHHCEKCKLTEWMGSPITIELEHKDGNKTNNNFENLLLLCPNCHSQTPTWRRRKSSL